MGTVPLVFNLSARGPLLENSDVRVHYVEPEVNVLRR
jgi:hypothetical protein